MGILKGSPSLIRPKPHRFLRPRALLKLLNLQLRLAPVLVLLESLAAKQLQRHLILGLPLLLEFEISIILLT